MSHEFLSLSQLNGLVKEVLKENLIKTYWIVAEISEIRQNYSGHCYLEFIQKDESSDNIVAKARANIWANTYRLIKPYFETSTNSSLAQGMKIMVNVSVEFHELYGYSLTIHDIDPAYTVGDMEQKKTLTIQKLVADGVFEMNRELEMTAVPQRIAIISSNTAAGYDDFISQLTNNEFGFIFYTCLFQSYMQGEAAESSILAAIDKINNNIEKFDVVVIIRGGGSRAELSCFDSYNLASNICQFPLPVIAGIGHERDQSVVDMVANTRVKTPTAAADFLIDKLSEFATEIYSMSEQIISESQSIIDNKMHEIELISERLTYFVKDIVRNRKERLYKSGYDIAVASSRKFSVVKSDIHEIEGKINYSWSDLIKSQKRQIKIENDKFSILLKSMFHIQNIRVDSTQRLLNQCEPMTILKKGFSITTQNGKQIKNIDNIVEGTQIETEFIHGKISSIVKK
ncbi:MAG: exodeoxyribonuclease VII large subunit [Bacteroidia bacterium]|nr:exodeoxyribonuclease VII large subunit [Bacteroidia bacterium]